MITLSALSSFLLQSGHAGDGCLFYFCVFRLRILLVCASALTAPENEVSRICSESPILAGGSHPQGRMLVPCASIASTLVSKLKDATFRVSTSLLMAWRFEHLVFSPAP
jgi:hypothetical protein